MSALSVAPAPCGLHAQELADIDASDNQVYLLDTDLRVLHRNPAATRFILDNSGQPGALPSAEPVTRHFAEPVRSFYKSLFEAAQLVGDPVDHDYDCSSPGLYRRFRLRIYPRPDGRLLLRHQCIVEKPHPAAPMPHRHDRYRTAEGLITQCCHCRATRRVDDPLTWDWVPELVETLRPDISHGLCHPCFEHYFPEAADARASA